VSATVVALALGGLNARGTEESGAFQVLVTGAKVAVLLAFIGGAAAHRPVSASLGNFTAAFQWDLPGILEVAALAFITFFGFSAIAASAGEIKNPNETVPKAIAASIATVTVLYTLVIVAMVNSPVPAEVVAEQGETAMGAVAESFLGSWGFGLIVAGAIFSMVSASNASILAASRIGYLMGREGRAGRRFQRIHPKYGTPAVSVAACTFTIVVLAVLFTGVFGHGGLGGLSLGLPALTGFANVNLLVPLSVVNVALVASRLRSPDVERPFEVPGSPLVPALGIAANLALIASLPFDGVVAGFLGIVVFLAVYAVWGGGLPVSEVTGLVSPAPEPIGEDRDPDPQAFRILVPVARGDDVPGLTRLADELGTLDERATEIDLVHVRRVPEQTPSDAIDTSDAEAWTRRARARLDGLDLHADTVERAFVSADVAFSILELAREEGADLLVMGHPTQHERIAEEVQRKAPCDVVFAAGVDRDIRFDHVTVGAGGGPDHAASLAVVDRMASRGTHVHVVRVEPTVAGTPERLEATLDELRDAGRVDVQTVEDRDVARGLVRAARDRGGRILLGGSRDHVFKQWVLGSTPDRTVELGLEFGVPVLVYQANPEQRSRASDTAFAAYRLLRTVLD
jgi:nucleotide-binding universal stress UspA family protein